MLRDIGKCPPSSYYGSISNWTVHMTSLYFLEYVLKNQHLILFMGSIEFSSFYWRWSLLLFLRLYNYVIFFFNIICSNLLLYSVKTNAKCSLFTMNALLYLTSFFPVSFYVYFYFKKILTKDNCILFKKLSWQLVGKSEYFKWFRFLNSVIISWWTYNFFHA